MVGDSPDVEPCYGPEGIIDGATPTSSIWT